MRELCPSSVESVEPRVLSVDQEFVLSELEHKGWCHLPGLFSPDVCDDIVKLYTDNPHKNFHKARVGRGTEKKLRGEIRQGLISWVDSWKAHSSLMVVDEYYQSLRELIREYFFLPIKWNEGQVALYRPGDFYKKHLDQLRETRHRQVTLVLFLNSNISGGELVLYNKFDKLKVDRELSPMKGSLVLFFSAQIFHEVKKAQEERFTLTTWMRDDPVPFLD